MKKKWILLWKIALILGISSIGITIVIKMDSQNKPSRQDILTLALKGNGYENLLVKIMQDDEEIILKYKNDIMVMETKEWLLWQNLNTYETITLVYESMLAKSGITAYINSLSRGANDGIMPKLKDKAHKYNFLREEFIKEYECIVFRLKKDEYNIHLIWIDKNTGLTVRHESEGWLNGERDKTVATMEYKFDIVTNEDVEKPDTSGYELIK